MTDYRRYWNDLEMESKKPYAIESKDDERLLKYLKEETNLERCFYDAVEYVDKNLGGFGERVLDVAAGVCWTTAILSKKESVKEVVGCDYSAHRIERFAPIAVKQFGGDESKLRLMSGDFFELPFEEESFDTVLFNHALFMFGDLKGTVKRAASLVRPGGTFMVTCDRFNPPSVMSLAFVKSIFTNPRDVIHLLRGADVTGFNYYLDADYRRAIEGAGLEFRLQELDYALAPWWNAVNTGNFFGIKREGA